MQKGPFGVMFPCGLLLFSCEVFHCDCTFVNLLVCVCVCVCACTTMHAFDICSLVWNMFCVHIYSCVDHTHVSSGPLIPYPNNPLNPAIHLEKSTNSTCGTWVSEYARLHDGELNNQLDNVSL